MASRTSSAAQRPTAASSIPRPPLNVHPAATISETAYFQGTHPISVGAGTVIHPRAKLLSFKGPVSIGEGCIIGEKSVIGGPVASNSGLSTPTTPSATATAAPLDFAAGLDPSSSPSPGKTVTIIENSVSIGPLATISAGSHIHSAAAIESSAFLGKDVKVGRHAKVCTSCSIPEGDTIEDWTVIWGDGKAGGGLGNKLKRRKRAAGKGDDDRNLHGMNGGLVETGRLVALNRERESLTRLIGIGAGKRR
ncbi:transferase hexapeptide domain-containing protein [Arthroderma uncinatum]|uniref:transferase hexapeptide domain-containing protein n=1 Tax=Arthroderma uncinatum TaxID=74035 RepID=UPI00144A5D58|nr:transferase hexapeptide domain-containing protein [Arthroderma uncinatum]KAF3490527.1 transferase hexapeptide domain-containing protein [Arthroderma uncinatum]